MLSNFVIIKYYKLPFRVIALAFLLISPLSRLEYGTPNLFSVAIIFNAFWSIFRPLIKLIEINK